MDSIQLLACNYQTYRKSKTIDFCLFVAFVVLLQRHFKTTKTLKKTEQQIAR